MVPVPPGFVDPFHQRGPWLPVSTPPEPYSWTIQVLFANGTTTTAVWLGQVFWTYHGEVQPIGWRQAEVLKMDSDSREASHR